MTSQPATAAASPFHPGSADPTPRPHPGDQLPIAGRIGSKLGGSRQATRGIEHRPNMDIPMIVNNPAKHNHAIGSILLCHVPTFRSLPTIPSPPEPGRAGDRTLKVEKSKLL